MNSGSFSRFEFESKEENIDFYLIGFSCLSWGRWPCSKRVPTPIAISIDKVTISVGGNLQRS